MGNYEKLRAQICSTKIGNALQIGILQHRDTLASTSSDDQDRYAEFHNLHEELNPKRKPTKKVAKEGEEEDEDAVEEEDDVDENAYKYCYWGKGKVKDPDTKELVEIEGEFPKKRFVTIATPVKMVLQYMLNCFVDECHTFYLENNNSFPNDNLLDAIQTFVIEQREDPIMPFVYRVSKLYKEIDIILEDENTKGTGVLGTFIENELKTIFEIKKSGKNTISKLYILRETFVNFIKVISVHIMDYLWWQRSPFNLGMLFGTFAQFSRMIEGCECPDNFYDYAKMYVKENENKKAAASTKAPAKGKGKGKGRGRPKADAKSADDDGEGDEDTESTEVAPKAGAKKAGAKKAGAKKAGAKKAGAKKGEKKAPAKKAVAKKAVAKKDASEEPDEQDDEGAIDDALDAQAGSDDGEEFDLEKFEDSPLPDDE